MTTTTLDTNHAHELPASQASARPAPTTSKKMLWAGRIVSGLVVLFLSFDCIIKLLKLPAAVEGSVKFGYTADGVFTIGVVGAVALILYVIPRTAALGALLWTGYLGGAIATHVTANNPLFSHTLFPIYVAVFLWGGLWLRDEKVRALLPIRAAK
jgi:hypothetical protein